MDVGGRFKAAVEAGDFEAAVELLADDVVFRSPAVHKAYEGKEAVGVVLQAVSRVFEDFRYVGELDGGGLHGLVFNARVGNRELQGIDLLRGNEQGMISELTVMIRPLSGLQALVAAMAEQLGLAPPAA